MKLGKSVNETNIPSLRIVFIRKYLRHSLEGTTLRNYFDSRFLGLVSER